MSIKNAKEILARLEDHEKRIRVLEIDKNRIVSQITAHASNKKQLTIAEIIRGKLFKSGQEKVAVIVGYYEKTLHQIPVSEKDIRTGWISGKFDGKYRSNLLERAVGDGLIRDLENGAFDLSQTGEKFFDNFLKSDVRNN